MVLPVVYYVSSILIFQTNKTYRKSNAKALVANDLHVLCTSVKDSKVLRFYFVSHKFFIFTSR